MPLRPITGMNTWSSTTMLPPILPRASTPGALSVTTKVKNLQVSKFGDCSPCHGCDGSGKVLIRSIVDIDLRTYEPLIREQELTCRDCKGELIQQLEELDK